MYKHSQLGTLILIALGVATIVSIATLFLTDHYNLNGVEFTVPVVFFILLSQFYSLTVEINQQTVVVKFGPGLIRKSILLADIKSCEIVRNKWWYGWGIRLTPHGWMFNISGLDAVEILRKNGKKFRIGTNDTRNLAEAINRKIGT